MAVPGADNKSTGLDVREIRWRHFHLIPHLQKILAEGNDPNSYQLFPVQTPIISIIASYFPVPVRQRLFWLGYLLSTLNECKHVSKIVDGGGGGGDNSSSGEDESDEPVNARVVIPAFKRRVFEGAANWCEHHKTVAMTAATLGDWSLMKTIKTDEEGDTGTDSAPPVPPVPSAPPSFLSSLSGGAPFSAGTVLVQLNPKDLNVWLDTAPSAAPTQLSADSKLSAASAPLIPPRYRASAVPKQPAGAAAVMKNKKQNDKSSAAIASTENDETEHIKSLLIPHSPTSYMRWEHVLVGRHILTPFDSPSHWSVFLPYLYNTKSRTEVYTNNQPCREHAVQWLTRAEFVAAACRHGANFHTFKEVKQQFMKLTTEHHERSLYGASAAAAPTPFDGEFDDGEEDAMSDDDGGDPQFMYLADTNTRLFVVQLVPKLHASTQTSKSSSSGGGGVNVSGSVVEDGVMALHYVMRLELMQ